MYVVVSKWETLPGKEDQFREAGRKARNAMRGTPGVESVQSLVTEDGAALAIIGYKDRSTYDKIVNDPNGPFAKTAQELQIEQFGRWAWSERGEPVAD